MPWVTSGDVDICWESHGNGEPVLLISGVSGGTWSWEEQLEAWSSRFRLIVFDHMGAGRSSMPDRPYRIEEMADHAAAVLDSAGEKRAHVVGLSMGGMVAQELSLNHAYRVVSLVLGCTHCGGRNRVPPDPEVIRLFVDNQGLTPEEIVDKNLAILVTPEFLQSGEDVLTRYRERQLRAPIQPSYALRRQLEAIRSFDSCDRIGAIAVPTLILTGDRDTLVPPENGRLLASRISGAVEKSFSSSGHLIYLESAQQFQETVMRFIQNHSSTLAK
ncbi:MAG: alpha/beta fold hydrolase [Deltaproteobacteria bacterium]|nr:MAG: alpha/beta fold hydrolase [Deltaproteobacteria bacterium]